MVGAASQNGGMTPPLTRNPRTAVLSALGLALALTVAASPDALAQTAAPAVPSRGELLYTTHCIACHTSQMHWRDKRVATDFPGVLAQVMTWQSRAQLNWTPEDIVEVARFVNDRYYRYPRTEPRAATELPLNVAERR